MVKVSCTRRTKAFATFPSLSPPSSKDMRMSSSKKVSSSETSLSPSLKYSFRKRVYAALVMDEWNSRCADESFVSRATI